MIGRFSTHAVAAPLAATRCGPDTVFHSVCIDSRRCTAGSLFVALPGSRVDGHGFIAQAAAAGAVAALVRSPQATELPQLVVADAAQALGQLGALNRERFSGALVAITGSCGKTTTRALLASVLARAGDTLATEGNYNNELGVPLTLLRLAPEHAFAVVEMGAAGIGHVDYLCRLARPTVSVVLNAMAAHLDGFGSVEGVARGKAEIYDHLGPEGVAVVNLDQPWAQQWRARAEYSGARVICYATGHERHAVQPDVFASDVEAAGAEGSRFRLHTPRGDAPVRLRLPGTHNIGNALAAAAAAHACGLEASLIAEGLAEVVPVAGRLQRHQCGSLTVLDDCYNANPGSVRVAIDLLAASPAPRVLVLGAMAELGEDSAALHREVGAYARASGLDALVGVGAALAPTVQAFGDRGQLFDTCAAADAAREHWLPPTGTLLLKGSRSAAMERLLDSLLQASQGRCVTSERERSPC